MSKPQAGTTNGPPMPCRNRIGDRTAIVLRNGSGGLGPSAHQPACASKGGRGLFDLPYSKERWSLNGMQMIVDTRAGMSPVRV